jgi:hypothetical protein
VRELLEEGQAVERPRRRLGVELDAREAVALEPLARPVVERHVRDVVVGQDGEAVVLDGDEHAAGGEVADGVVRAAVAEGKSERLVPEREPEQLVAEADPVHRHLPEQRADRLDLVDEDGRVAGAVRDEHGARPRLEDRVGVPPARHDVRLDPGGGEARRDRALRAEVDHDHARPGADGVRLLGADGAVERAAVDRRLGERAGVERLLVSVSQRTAERLVRVADPLHERARVDGGERDHAAVAEPARERRPRLAHDHGLALHAIRLHARLVDAVRADERIGEAEHLRDVARVGDRLLVARHRSGEAGLPRRHARRADTDPREHGAVLQYQPLLHGLHLHA